MFEGEGIHEEHFLFVGAKLRQLSPKISLRRHQLNQFIIHNGYPHAVSHALSCCY
ncbi:MAG: hypothetical protein IJ849_08235 [Selenomonadaceae bacterium]|nr:hypothetical protein [Selenomonadaceae bacterium]